MGLGLLFMLTACAWAGFLIFKELSVLQQGKPS